MKWESDGNPHSDPLPEWKGCQGGVQGRNLLDNPGTEGILFAVRGDTRLMYPVYLGIQEGVQNSVSVSAS